MSVLKALRLQKGWTIKEICKRSGIKESKYMKIERSETSILHHEADILASLFDVNTDKLFNATRVKAKEMEEIV